MQEKDSTFITGSSGENWEKIKFSADDVKLINHFSAHTDAISWVTWVPELRVVATSSFDKNVYMWSTDFERSDEGKKMGLLVLGNKATAKDAEVDKETQKYRDKWLISVDKETRYQEQLHEASLIWEEVKAMDYEKMKQDQIER